ncbi:hypothetical protein [Mesomycoplasma hyorhinis]|uniref:hypothetical protein n=1 Tax=Mesomycoplasma hyorhinis TaxID=2100 RepID=UPI001F1D30BA|nr:hypothetical protein [Mesomycoplasma hyorhinis]
MLSANNTDLKKLFLEKSFNETKIKAKEIISNIFNFYVNSVNITDDQKQRLATKIKENKEKLVFMSRFPFLRKIEKGIFYEIFIRI